MPNAVNSRCRSKPLEVAVVDRDRDPDDVSRKCAAVPSHISLDNNGIITHMDIILFLCRPKLCRMVQEPSLKRTFARLHLNRLVIQRDVHRNETIHLSTGYPHILKYAVFRWHFLAPFRPSIFLHRPSVTAAAHIPFTAAFVHRMFFCYWPVKGSAENRWGCDVTDSLRSA